MKRFMVQTPWCGENGVLPMRFDARVESSVPSRKCDGLPGRDIDVFFVYVSRSQAEQLMASLALILVRWVGGCKVQAPLHP